MRPCNEIKMVVLFACILVASAEVLSDVAPDHMCKALIPDSHVHPERSECPYELKVEILKGRQLRLRFTIQSKTQDYSLRFRGFMLQVRNKIDGDPVGEFEIGRGCKILNCPPRHNNTLIHSYDRKKKKIQANWIWPQYFKGKAYAIATVAREEDQVWVGITADLFTYPQDWYGGF